MTDTKHPGPFDPTALDRPARDDGGPAFPMPIADIQGVATRSIDFGPGMTGMTLRDYFAAQAMAAFIVGWKGSGVPITPDTLAQGAYEQADAMIEARGK